VSDTGIGIRDEELPTLFDSFSQLDTRKNRSIEGTGLGLAIVKNLVEMMGGEVSVESEYGIGTCFSFYIVQQAVTLQSMLKLPWDERRRVAVWDANEEKSQVLADKIRKLGAQCDIIRNPDNINDYTHVFFDVQTLGEASGLSCPGTKLITVAHRQVDKESLPANIEILHMPLTSVLLTRSLGGFADSAMKGDTLDSGFSVQLHDVRMLVVDDIDINLIIAEETLAQYGGKVDLAFSGAKAIELILENNYDVVFMDHMMPEMDGVDVTRAVRALPGDRFRELPIIALTANVVGDVKDMFIESGMNDFLSKPLEQAEIERVLRKWLPQEKWANV